VKVKICGITSLEDAAMCEELGADALGFVHVDGRSRTLPLGTIREICGSVGPMTTKVLVCSPRSCSDAERMFDASGADILQLHSLEPDDLDVLRHEGMSVIRAVAPDRSEAVRFAPHTDALLFEGGTPGTGAAYDYSTVPVSSCRRCIIAGGLTVANMDRALEMRPYALDVSSGVERLPGRKDRELVSGFIRRCKA
jgi:phosphoribosylanthranilate isomerase